MVNGKSLENSKSIFPELVLFFPSIIWPEMGQKVFYSPRNEWGGRGMCVCVSMELRWTITISRQQNLRLYQFENRFVDNKLTATNAVFKEISWKRYLKFKNNEKILATSIFPSPATFSEAFISRS